MKPLPAMDCLDRWSQLADIHLLSNHCKEWIEPILTRIEKYTKSITISNQVGYWKLQQQIYELVETQFEYKDLIIYVDDQEKNLKPAMDIGWTTILADEHNKWIQEIEPIINKT
jgi:FMN phosphatase YigB (HAD superfamily)